MNQTKWKCAQTNITSYSWIWNKTTFNVWVGDTSTCIDVGCLFISLRLQHWPHFHSNLEISFTSTRATQTVKIIASAIWSVLWLQLWIMLFYYNCGHHNQVYTAGTYAYLVASIVEQVHSTSLRENTSECPYLLEKSLSATVQEYKTE